MFHLEIEMMKCITHFFVHSIQEFLFSKTNHNVYPSIHRSFGNYAYFIVWCYWRITSIQWTLTGSFAPLKGHNERLPLCYNNCSFKRSYRAICIMVHIEPLFLKKKEIMIVYIIHHLHKFVHQQSKINTRGVVLKIIHAYL